MSVEQRPFLSRSLARTLYVALCLSVVGCAKDDDEKVQKKAQAAANDPATARCEQGITKATRQNDIEKATRIYFESCAAIHKKPGCQKAWRKAATAPPDQQMKIVAMGCSKAYCDELGKKKYALCKKDLKPTPEALKKAWPPFHDAILRREHKDHARQIRLALLSFYAHRQNLMAKAEEKKAETTDGAAKSTDAASAAPGGSAKPSSAPSGSPPGAKAPAAKPAPSAKSSGAAKPTK